MKKTPGAESDGAPVLRGESPASGSPEAAGLPASDVRVPGFQILGTIGTSIRGAVYRVSDGRRAFAVKVLRRGVHVDRLVLERFLKTSPNRINHPNLCSLELLGETEGGFFFYAMPLLRGDSLDQLLIDLRRGSPQRPSLSPLAVGPAGETHPDLARRAAELLAEAAEGLARAHAEGITHKRLRPQNLILTPAGRLVITDFGGDAATDGGHSLAYRAPEQLEPYPESESPAADVYALGVILYETLTRRLPFEGTSPRELKGRIRDGRFAAPRTLSPDLPPEMEACILKAMALRPQDRYADAGMFASDLRRFLRHEAPQALAAESQPSARRPWGWSGLIPRVAAALALGLVLLGAWWVGKSGVGGRVGGDADPHLLVSPNPGGSGAISGRTDTRREPATVKARANLLRPPRELNVQSFEAFETSRPLLEAVGIGEGWPTVSIDGATFAALEEALERIGDEEAFQLLCRWGLEPRLALDRAPRPAASVLPPNLILELGFDAPSNLVTRWLRAMAKLDPGSLLEAVPVLSREEERLQELVLALETAGGAEAAEAIALLVRRRYTSVGAAGLKALSRLGAYGPLLDLVRSELPLSVREEALQHLGDGYAGLCLKDLHALTVLSPEPSIRKLAFLHLSTFDDPEAAAALPGALADPDLRGEALEWLKRLPSQGGGGVLVGLLEHPEEPIRELAAGKLRESRTPDLAANLSVRLLSANPAVREATFEILAARGELSRVPEVFATLLGTPGAFRRENPTRLIDFAGLARGMMAQARQVLEAAREAILPADWLGRLVGFTGTLPGE